MIRIEAPSRLHFGLFNVGAEKAWPNVHGQSVLPVRRFGGVGLMIDEPALVLYAEPAPDWSASGPRAERALEFARCFAATLPGGLAPQRITIERAPPEHVGLGTGTQLGLAVAKALALTARQHTWDAVELARRVGRGLRSAVGIHGFQHGGLIVEGGKRDPNDIAPLVVRAEFPAEWRVVLAIPANTTGLHGQSERQAFDKLHAAPIDALDGLSRLVLLGLLPALAERDGRTFGEALYDFNARAGEAFAAVQNGRYASAFVADTVAFLRGLGVSGAGQSSWGPSVFAVVSDEDQARNVAGRLRHRHAAEMLVTRANACGMRAG